MLRKNSLSQKHNISLTGGDNNTQYYVSAGFYDQGSLYTYGNDEKNEYKNVAATILKNLSSPPYKSEGDEVGGFLLKHSVGNLPAKSEIDVPLSYADYYFVEVAMRYLGKLPVERTKANK